MIVFLLIAVSIWTGAHYYLRLRLVTPADIHPALKFLGTALILLFMFAAPVSFWVHGQGGDQAWKGGLEWIGYTAMGLSALLFGVTVLRDLIWLAAVAADWLASLKTGRELLPPGPARMSVFNLTSLGVVLVTGVLASIGFRAVMAGPRVMITTIVIPGLSPGLDGFRIALIGDLHLSRMTPRGFTRRLAGQVNALDPDLVAFVGDYGDGNAATLRNEAMELSAIRARHGKFFVTGNHDYYSDFPRWVGMAEQAGFRVLLNENRPIDVSEQRFAIAGVTDHGAGDMGSIGGHRTDFEKAAAGIDPRSFSILLSHQPRDLDLAERLGFDLMLCGHTHGGQFFPYTHVVRLFFRHARGLHDVGRMKLYVTRGTGYWGPPLRIGSSAEIGLLILRSGGC